MIFVAVEYIRARVEFSFFLAAASGRKAGVANLYIGACDARTRVRTNLLLLCVLRNASLQAPHSNTGYTAAKTGIRTHRETSVVPE